MNFNIELYQKTLRHIEEHPEEFNQTESWLQGYSPDPVPETGGCGCFFAHALRIAGVPNRASFTVDVYDRGADVLGLEELGFYNAISYWLFSSARTLDDFRIFGRTLYGYYRQEK